MNKNETINTILKEAYGACEIKPNLIGGALIEVHDNIGEILESYDSTTPTTGQRNT